MFPPPPVTRIYSTTYGDTCTTSPPPAPQDLLEQLGSHILLQAAADPSRTFQGVLFTWKFCKWTVAADVISLAPSRRDHPSSAATVPEPSGEFFFKNQNKNSNNFFMYFLN